MTRAALVAAVAAALALPGCGDPEKPPAPKPRPAPVANPAASVDFSQILILYVPVKERPRVRSHDEAFAAAQRLIERAKAGERFENLIVEATDDVKEDGKPFNDGSYTLPVHGAKDPILMKYLLLLAPGEVGEPPYDTGQAMLVVRRDR